MAAESHGDASSVSDGGRESPARFSYELYADDRHGPAQPRLRLNTDLYTIESRAEPLEVPQRREVGMASSTGHAEASSSRPHHQDGRRSVISFMESPVSVTRPRHLGGFDGTKDSARASETSNTLAHYRNWVARQRERRRRWKSGPYGRMKSRIGALNQKYIVEGLLRQRPLPPSKDGRHVPVLPRRTQRKPLTDERTGKPYVSNFIRSTRYTIWDFVPRQLFFQFSKLANFYFLLIAIMQCIPGLSTTGNYTTLIPLTIFVFISMAKEGYDDYRRYKLDKTENRSQVLVLDPSGSGKREADRKQSRLKEKLKRRPAEADNEMGMVDLEGGSSSGAANRESWSSVQWQDLKVGDIIRLRRDEQVPADIIILRASGPNGITYIDTMALDGETNLKSKQACPLLAEHCGSTDEISKCDAVVVSEDPNLDLYNYDGRAIVKGETMPLTMNQVVYRGSTVRNTRETVGLVVNSGEECKIRMNAHKNAHAKAPAMQAKVNRIIILLVFFVILLSLGCTLANHLWVRNYESSAWYLQGATVYIQQIIIGFIIMFNTLIPLSLYISLEIIKVGQLILLQDVEMYDPETDTPMVANTTTILENLGQVSYVFSDKTGTLTENKMRFRKMSVAGTAWLHDMDVARDAQAREEKELKRRRKRGKKSEPSQRKMQKVSVGDLTQSPEPFEAPLITRHNAEKSGPRRSSSMSLWRSTVRPSRAQPELKTEDLISYIRNRPHTPFSKKARHFILCIALCHTCLPEMKDDGEMEFQAASPDELALVQAARDLGYLLIDRPAQSIKLQFNDLDGTLITETYEVLDVIEFSSKRKRMSIVIRMPDGRVCLFTKGADSVILPRLKLKQIALQKASAVERRASKRKSVEQEKAMRRRSTVVTPRQSLNIARASLSMARRGSTKRSVEYQRRSQALTDGVDEWLRRREREEVDGHGGNDDAYRTPISAGGADDWHDGLVDESLAVNDTAVFDRCFQHIDDFASEGLRTLLFAYRYIDDEDYKKWKTLYHDATTSLVNRQDRIEAAAELIEQNLDLAGATAIEDKLQQGVPETIDKLRRANIKVWMLTGDKRETAINIAHSARICKPFSEVYILDAEDGDLQERIASTLVDVGRGMTPHYVVVIDGHTLSVVEAEEEMKILFFDLVTRVDSVICCRASPSQKATLVKCIRERVENSMTLAIGDGANDIAMIQASHVGIGISGLEGLQAARIADYSIAQFRFLQRLLFVHGRWNYIRTGKYVLATFWKEIVFYLVQAQYQRYNGYTGTSLYESWSLTVFNTLFTSLPVILIGIFEQDIRAETLLAVPELYTFGQRNKGFNFRLYVGWMIMGVAEAVLIFYIIYHIYSASLFSIDTSLFAMGTLAFTVCVVFINVKMLALEMHNQTLISGLGLFISVTGWFAWNIFLSAIYMEKPGPYLVRGSFLRNFGRNAIWWSTGIVVLAVVVMLELVVTSIRRVYFPQDQDLMQEMETIDGIKAVLREHAAETGEAGDFTSGGGGGTEAKSPKSDDDAESEISARMAGWGFERGYERTPVDITAVSASKRASRVLDDYIPPPFTPPAEERDDPFGMAMGKSDGKKRAGGNE